MKLLVTGFGAFPGVSINTSEQLVAAWMRDRPDWPFDDMKFEVLPTTYDIAGARVSELIREYQPDHALLLGVATTQSTVRLERFALNIDDSTVPDAAGTLRQSRIIAPDRPHAMTTPIDLDRLRAALMHASVIAEISNHAGTYVCNHTYYSALLAASQFQNRCDVLFVHVPGIHKSATNDERAAATDAIRQVVSALVRSLATC